MAAGILVISVEGIVPAAIMIGNIAAPTERLPLAAALSVLALILANPLGMALQREVTTCGVPGAMTIVRVESRQRGRWISHRVITRG